MKGVVIFTVLAFISYVLHRVFIFLSKGDPIDRIQCSGIITKVIENDVGGIRYYITFINQVGNEMVGQSIDYKRTHNKYHVHDPVDIKYFITKKGKARIMVNDSELEPYADVTITVARNMKITSIIFIMIAVIFMIQYVLI